MSGYFTASEQEYDQAQQLADFFRASENVTSLAARVQQEGDAAQEAYQTALQTQADELQRALERRQTQQAQEAQQYEGLGVAPSEFGAPARPTAPQPARAVPLLTGVQEALRPRGTAEIRRRFEEETAPTPENIEEIIQMGSNIAGTGPTGEAKLLPPFLAQPLQRAAGQVAGAVRGAAGRAIASASDALELARSLGVSDDVARSVVSQATESGALPAVAEEVPRFARPELRALGATLGERLRIPTVAPEVVEEAGEAAGPLARRIRAGQPPEAVAPPEDALARLRETITPEPRPGPVGAEYLPLPGTDIASVVRGTGRMLFGEPERLEQPLALGAGAGTGIAEAIRAQQEGAEPGEVAKRAGLGFVGGTIAGRAASRLPMFGRELAEQLGEQAGRLGVTPAAYKSAQTAGEALDAIGKMYDEGLRVAQKPATAIEETLTSFRTRLGQLFIGGDVPLSKVQQLIKERLGRNLTPAEDAETVYRLYAGRHTAAAQHIADELTPHIQGLSRQEERVLEQYLTAADNVDKAASIGRTFGQAAAEARRFPGGVRAVPLADVEGDLVARYGQQTADKIRTAAQGVWDFTSGLRDRLADAGVVSRTLRDHWEQQFPHYIPAEILKYLPETGGPVAPGAGRNVLTLADLGAKRLTEVGTEAARQRPITSAMRLAFAVENQARRNQGAQALLALRQADPELQGLMVPVLSRAQARAQGLAKDAYRHADYRLTADETKFSALVDGELREFVVPRFLEPLFRAEPKALPGYMQTALTVAKALSGAPLLRAGATSLNAAFIPTNMIRDALVFLAKRDISKVGTTAPALARAYLDLIRRAPEKIPDWNEAIKLGAGQFSEFSGRSPEQIRRLALNEGYLSGHVRPIEGLKDVVGALGDVVSLSFEPIRRAGERVETAPRLAAFRLAKQSGVAPEQAAVVARDITVDFSRGGDIVRFANQFVPFLNAYVQGMDRGFNWMTRNPKQAAGAITAGLGAVTMAEAWNRTRYPEEYADVPDYLKGTGIVLITPVNLPPREDGTERGHLKLWLPLPNEFQLLQGLTKFAIERYATGEEPTWQRIAGTVLPTTLPPGVEAGMVPPTARVAHEMQSNYDLFRRRAIVPEELRNLAAVPEEQVTPRTSAGARVAGQALGVSPLKIEHAVAGVAGGVGRQALEATNIAARALGRGDLAPQIAPESRTVADIFGIGGIAARFARTEALGQRRSNLLQEFDKRVDAEVKQEIDALRANPGFQAMSRAEQIDEMRRTANEIKRSYDEDRQDLIELTRTQAGPQVAQAVQLARSVGVGP